MRFITMALVPIAAVGAAVLHAETPDWSKAQPVSIELSSFKFTPSTLELQSGRPYRLHLTNSSSGGHDFAAKEFFAASTISQEDQAKAKGGKLGLKSGESADIRLVPGTAGSYALRCTHFMHSTFGMTGTITVR
jgi:uncharacterized cupredoxin-like copper-binding protein